MKIEMKEVSSIKPYDNNPRDNNEDAVAKVAQSIKEFGFKVPIIISKDNIIVAGHTRHLAAQRLNLTQVPCIVADDLTESQIKAFRIADNRVAEESTWDISLLTQELDELDNLFTGFDIDEEVMFASIEELERELDEYVEPEPTYYCCPECQYRAEKEEFL